MRQNILKRKLNLRAKRKRRVRAKIFGTSELVRVSIFKSNRAIYAQAIDDVNGVTLASVDGNKLGFKANIEDATKLAEVFAQTLKSKDMNKVLFDRNGYLYHGVVAAFAQGLRDNGITL